MRRGRARTDVRQERRLDQVWQQRRQLLHAPGEDATEDRLVRAYPDAAVASIVAIRIRPRWLSATNERDNPWRPGGSCRGRAPLGVPASDIAAREYIYGRLLRRACAFAARYDGVLRRRSLR
jgi:hypothetical protein